VIEIDTINTDGSGVASITTGPALNTLPSWSTPVAP
jgi:hypothetical protein